MVLDHLRKIYIVVCDDNPQELAELAEIANRFAMSATYNFEVKPCSSREQISFFLDDTGDIDILFMDIEMAQDNGIEIVRGLRDRFPYMPVIFVTNYEEYRSEAYDVYNFNYLRKPVNENIFKHVCYKAVDFICKNDEIFSFSFDGIVNQLSTRDILYFEGCGHSVHVITENETYCVTMALSKLMELVKNGRYRFVMPHRSYFVNMINVRCLAKNELIMKDGRSVPVSRSYKANVKAYFDSSGNKKLQVMT